MARAVRSTVSPLGSGILCGFSRLVPRVVAIAHPLSSNGPAAGKPLLVFTNWTGAWASELTRAAQAARAENAAQALQPAGASLLLGRALLQVLLELLAADAAVAVGVD